jgi:hypothetical protein
VEQDRQFEAEDGAAVLIIDGPDAPAAALELQLVHGQAPDGHGVVGPLFWEPGAQHCGWLLLQSVRVEPAERGRGLMRRLLDAARGLGLPAFARIDSGGIGDWLLRAYPPAQRPGGVYERLTSRWERATTGGPLGFRRVPLLVSLRMSSDAAHDLDAPDVPTAARLLLASAFDGYTFTDHGLEVERERRLEVSQLDDGWHVVRFDGQVRLRQGELLGAYASWRRFVRTLQDPAEPLSETESVSELIDRPLRARVEALMPFVSLEGVVVGL